MFTQMSTSTNFTGSSWHCPWAKMAMLPMNGNDLPDRLPESLPEEAPPGCPHSCALVSHRRLCPSKAHTAQVAVTLISPGKLLPFHSCVPRGGSDHSTRNAVYLPVWKPFLVIKAVLVNCKDPGQRGNLNPFSTNLSGSSLIIAQSKEENTLDEKWRTKVGGCPWKHYLAAQQPCQSCPFPMRRQLSSPSNLSFSTLLLLGNNITTFHEPSRGSQLHCSTLKQSMEFETNFLPTGYIYSHSSLPGSGA